MTGEVTLPETAAPRESGKGLAEEVKTSYVAPAGARLDVLRPTSIADPQPDPSLGGLVTPIDPLLSTRTATGGELTTTGLTRFEVCNPYDLAYRQGPTYRADYPLCPELNSLGRAITDPRREIVEGNRSKGNQFTVAWEGPASINAALPAATDVSDFGVLDLRAATNRHDLRNPAGDNFTPASATQDFDVTLIDAAGNRATTNAAAWTTSLEPSIGTVYRHIVLNGIRIPLGTFRGVDLTQVTAVELGFGTRTPSGSIQLADVMFQETAKPVDPVIPAPDGPPSIPPGPIVNPPRTVPVADVCTDTTKPTVKLTQLAAKTKKLWVQGVALDSGCAGGSGKAAGGVASTLVEIYRPVSGGKARFVTARGTLSKPLPLAGGIAIKARGKGSWSVGVAKAKLPRGSYRVRVSTFDRSGNLRTLGVRRVTLK
jgi:hypothetical protein